VDGRDPFDGVERVAFAEEVSSAMRHAVRNKLAAARNAATYIQRRLSKTEAWQSDTRIQTFHGLIESELDAAGGMLDPKDALAHLFTRHAERVPASRCIREAVGHARVGTETARTVRVEAPDDAEVIVDPRELALAVRCLVENAIEATGGNGPVSVRGSREGDRFVIEVADDGPGIEESRWEDAMQAFFTTKPGHAGLGLAIARRIARRYDGAFALGSSPSGGLVARIELPTAGVQP
jgi:signal transduction histidine kinase